jgi:hypothetical protein
VIFQGFATTPRSHEIRRMAEKSADFHPGNKSDSKKSKFPRQIGFIDIAGTRAITFFGAKAF